MEKEFSACIQVAERLRDAALNAEEVAKMILHGEEVLCLMREVKKLMETQEVTCEEIEQAWMRHVNDGSQNCDDDDEDEQTDFYVVDEATGQEVKLENVNEYDYSDGFLARDEDPVEYAGEEDDLEEAMRLLKERKKRKFEERVQNEVQKRLKKKRRLRKGCGQLVRDMPESDSECD